MFQDRRDAGLQLAFKLQKYKAAKDTLVVGLARGGVATADAIAKELKLPLAALVVRKIGAPGNSELAIGAISETGDLLFNDELIALTGATKDYLKRTVEKETKVALERSALYRKNRPQQEFAGKTIILVDDGIATGATMEVAIHSMRKASAKKIILAVPVGAPDSLERLKKQVDELIFLFAPASFSAVGEFYRAFAQVSDAEVLDILHYE